ncbi:MAG: VWA domain-containing protein [Thermaceae bacterium]|nr:VWA domain-containing protein [Thermaceae bacterium]
MSFTWPTFLWLLLLPPLLVWGLWRMGRRREQTAKVFADMHLLASVVRQPPKAHVRWPLALQLLALALLLLAAARPVASSPLLVNQAAVVIVVDTSASMQAPDLTPSRLEAAKAVAREFVKLAPTTTQIGLVSFSDNASALVLPTTDRQKVLDGIARLKASFNTSIASGIVTAVRILPGRKNLKPPAELLPSNLAQGDPLQIQPDLPQSSKADFPPGSIMLLSDGAANISSNPGLPTLTALDIAARFAKDNGVKIYTFPLGREGGTVVQLDGQSYFVPFEPRNLERIAQDTGGKNVYPPNDDALKAVFKELGTVLRWQFTRLEVSSLLSALAIVLMLIGAGLNLRWQRRVV